MDLETAQTTTTAKFPILKQGEYDMWRLRIEQYFQVQDYALWDVIENGNSFKPAAQTTTNADGTSTSLIPGPVTTEEKVQKKNDVKARSMLLMALPNEHLMTFNQYKDAKTLFAAIQTRFGESLDSIFNRLQKIVSQLAILGENISQEDLNLKFLRSLPSEWNTHVVVWRNKPDLDTMSFDDLYNNFKIVEQEVKRTASSSSSSSSQNMAFVSSPSISTANLSDATVYAFLANQPNRSQLVHEYLEQIHEDDLEEMDLKWQLALLSMRTRRFFQKTGRKITINGSDTARYDKSKVGCFNFHKIGHFTRECRGPRNQDSRNRNQDSSKRTVNVEETSSKAMVAIDGDGFDWSYMADDEVPTNMALMAFSDSEVHNDKTCSKTCLKSFETLKTQLDDLRIEFNKSEFNLATYKRGLASVEEQLVFYKKNEVIFCEQLAVLKRDISYKDSEISMLKSELEKLKQEKESNQLKIENFDNASKSLDKLIGSQISSTSIHPSGDDFMNSFHLCLSLSVAHSLSVWMHPRSIHVSCLDICLSSWAFLCLFCNLIPLIILDSYSLHYIRMTVVWQMVNTRQSTSEFLGPAFDKAVQRAVNALLPDLTAHIANELRQNGAGSSGIGWQVTKLEEMLSWWKAVKQAKGGDTHVVPYKKDFVNSSFYSIFLGLSSKSMRGNTFWIRQRDGELSGVFVTRVSLEIKIFRERSSQNNKRNRDGDRIRPTAQDSKQRGYDQKGDDGRGHDRQDGNSDQKSRHDRDQLLGLQVRKDTRTMPLLLHVRHVAL
ncbi:ribonuclease H-like domain-containing protein [Tanacetum coccineum]